MVLDNRLINQFKRNQLTIGLCDSDGNEPEHYSYKRVPLDSNKFVKNKGIYVGIHDIVFNESQGRWGIIDHAIVFDFLGEVVGFDRFNSSKAYNIGVGVKVIFFSGNFTIRFI